MKITATLALALEDGSGNIVLGREGASESEDGVPFVLLAEIAALVSDMTAELITELELKLAKEEKNDNGRISEGS